MEEAISRIVTELEEIRHSQPPQPISDSSLSDLQTLLAPTLENDSESTECLYDELSSKTFLPSNLVTHIASAMDLGLPHLSISASEVYLSLFLSPNSPVFTLFTLMAFFSLLHSIRHSLKHRPSREGCGEPAQGSGGRKRKTGVKGRVSKKQKKSSYYEDHKGEEGDFDLRALFSVLKRLERVMGLIHLDRFPDSLKSLVQTLAEIPVIGLEVSNLGNYNKLMELCSKIFLEVLKPEHGDQAETTAEVLKWLSPMILLSKSQARTFALGFVSSRMISLAQSSDDGVAGDDGVGRQ